MENENESKENEEGKPAEATLPENAGVQSETTSELDRADRIAERQKKENDRREEILTREENLAARKRVGGVTEAGQQPVKKEETDKEYSERIDQEIRDGKYNG